MSKEFDQKFDLQPLPRVECPDWVGENVRGIYGDVLGHIEKAQAVRDEVEKSIEKMSNQLALADFTLPTPAEKAKTRNRLLQSELRAREQAADYYSALRLESREVRPALQAAHEAEKKRVQEGLFALGFDDFDPSLPFVGNGRSDWIGEAQGVRAARAKLLEPSSYITDVMHDYERFNAVRMQSVQKKLVEIRDSLVAELV